MRCDNKVRELATVCSPWQQWTETSVWFDNVGILAFHSCVVVDLWQSLSELCLLLSECVLVCRRENVGAWIRARNEHVCTSTSADHSSRAPVFFRWNTEVIGSNPNWNTDVCLHLFCVYVVLWESYRLSVWLRNCETEAKFHHGLQRSQIN
jgi:hypothetical protein